MPETVVPVTEKCQAIKYENQSEDERVGGITICDTNIEFAGRPEYLRRSKQVRQDPTSHRIIEKRRRDRMNNCLADLSRLIPPDYLKKGRGRIEKTEIIEMATRYIKYLQSKRNSTGQDVSPSEHFRRGYQECLSEALQYLIEKQGYYATDAVCVQFINHLQRHCAKINKGEINRKEQSSIDSSSQASSGKHISHNPQFILSHNFGNTKESSRHKHSSSYSMCNDYSVDGKQIQTNGGNISPEGSVMGYLNSFSQESSSMLNHNNNNCVSTDQSNNLEDEDGSTKINIMRNMMYIDNDDYTPPRETQNQNDFTSVSYNNTQNNSENSLRNVRKQELIQSENVNFSVDIDNHSYKFKNTIKQRFSQSQSTGYRSSSLSDGHTNIGSTSSNDPSPPRREHIHGSVKFNHKRRKASEHHNHNRHNISDSYDQSSSGTNSSENNTKRMNSIYKANNIVDCKDSLLEESINSDNILSVKVNVNHKYEDKFDCPVGVPIFALHAKGSFYVPMNVHYDSLIPFLGPYDLLDITTLQPNIALHPVTINVNFQPA